MSPSLYDIELTKIDGQTCSMSEYRDQVLLIVNTASRCGFTSQYEGLEKIYQKYKDKNFKILAFPCNQFGSQEPGDEEEIKDFCQLNYAVSFPLFSKIEVNGSDTHPLYQILKKEAPGLLKTQAIKWNFTKFLVDSKGNVLRRFAPKDKPEDIEKYISKLL